MARGARRIGALAANKMQVIYIGGIDEPLWASDVEYLVLLKLVPAWMSPSALGYNEERITISYYELVKQKFAVPVR